MAAQTLSAELQKMQLQTEPLRVLVACDNDPADPRSYSGTLASILRLLEALPIRVVATVDCSRAARARRGGLGARRGVAHGFFLSK